MRNADCGFSMMRVCIVGQSHVELESERRNQIMNKIMLMDEEIELLAKALMSYKSKLSSLGKNEEEFASFEIQRADEIAEKLGITTDHFVYG